MYAASKYPGTYLSTYLNSILNPSSKFQCQLCHATSNIQHHLLRTQWKQSAIYFWHCPLPQRVQQNSQDGILQFPQKHIPCYDTKVPPASLPSLLGYPCTRVPVYLPALGHVPVYPDGPPGSPPIPCSWVRGRRD